MHYEDLAILIKISMYFFQGFYCLKKFFNVSLGFFSKLIKKKNLRNQKNPPMKTVFIPS